jgi:hypothetical protein
MGIFRQLRNWRVKSRSLVNNFGADVMTDQITSSQRLSRLRVALAVLAFYERCPALIV